jgi:hypothetical protein
MQTSDPQFEARPGDNGWCVHVRWPSGKTEIVPGFANQYQALDWIKFQAANWVADRIMRDPGIG